MALMEPGGDEWTVDDNGTNRDLSLKEYRLGFGAEWVFVSHIVLFAQAGTVVGRELELRGGGEPEQQQDIDSTWYGRIGLRYR